MLMPSFSIWSVISFSMSHFSGQVQKTKTKAELPDMPVIEIVQMLMQEDEFSTVKNCCWAGSTWSLPFKLKVRLNPSCFRMNTQLEYDHSAALKSFVFFYFVYYWVQTQHSAVSPVGLSVIKGFNPNHSGAALTTIASLKKKHNQQHLYKDRQQQQQVADWEPFRMESLFSRLSLVLAEVTSQDEPRKLTSRQTEANRLQEPCALTRL